MSREEHRRRLERMYVGAPCNEYYAPRIAIGEGVCDVVIPVQEKFFHSGGAVHGSVYFKVMDDAAFFAANSLVEEVLVLTATFTVSFLRPISRGELRARGTVVHAADRLLFAESVVSDSEGKVIGRGNGGFVRSRIALTPEIGYA
ncbi:MAG TPA: PaaI family thioesterase [Thermoanaerobaculia bacterium]